MGGRVLWEKLKAALARGRNELELDEELNSHLQLSVDENMQRGMEREEATRQARIQLGGVERTKEGVRAQAGFGWPQSLVSDVTFAFRVLRASPAYAVSAILVLALGIGVNTSIFTVLDDVVSDAIQVADADELVAMRQDFQGRRIVHGAHALFSTSEYHEYARQSRTVPALAAFTTGWSVALEDVADRPAFGKLVSCNYFEVLRVRPILGAGFPSNGCDDPGTPPTVVLGFDLWQARLGGDMEIVGKSVRLNQQPFIVAGVMPRSFRGTEIESPGFWAPLATQPLLGFGDLYRNSQASWLMLIGRRNTDRGIGQVSAELQLIASRIDAQQPGRTTKLEVGPANKYFFAPMRRTATLAVSTVTSAVFGFILLISCANVATLQLTRFSARRREVAVRLSLGATPARLLQQLLVESCVVALVGGALGLLVALAFSRIALTSVLANLPASFTPVAVDVSPDWRVLLFGVVVSIGAGFVCGWIPASRAARSDPGEAIKGGASTPPPRDSWVVGILLGIQSALAMVLVIGTALLGRGLQTAETIEPGFDYDRVAVASFNLSRVGAGPLAYRAPWAQLATKLQTIPGVDAVARVGTTPLGTRMETGFSLPGSDTWSDVNYNTVSPSYFPIVGIPITRGRSFTASELQSAPLVAIVTEATARRLWEGENPLGKRIQLPSGGGTASVEIVGVARDAQLTRLGQIDSNFLYLPAPSEPEAQMTLLLQSRLSVARLSVAVQQTVAEVNPSIIATLSGLESNLSQYRIVSRLVTTLAAALGGLALLISAAGVFGAVSYASARRRREAGVRLALGASHWALRRALLAKTLRPVVAGILAGAALAAAGSRVIESMLFGISALDGIAFGAAFLVFGIVALFAANVPLSKIIAVDPVSVLRQD